MSWADDIRCLYCDGRLPLYRKITHGQFCSSAHRKAYWQEQENLAVQRLHQTHNSLKAFRQIGPAPLGDTARLAEALEELAQADPLAGARRTPAASAAATPVDTAAYASDPDVPELAGLLMEPVTANPEPSRYVIVADPLEYEAEFAPLRPQLRTEHGGAERVRLAHQLVVEIWMPQPRQARLVLAGAGAFTPHPLPVLIPENRTAELTLLWTSSPLLPLAIRLAPAVWVSICKGEAGALEFKAALPQHPALKDQVSSGVRRETLALMRVAPREDIASLLRFATEPHPIQGAPSPVVPRGRAALWLSPQALVSGRLLPLPVIHVPAHGVRAARVAEALRTLDVRPNALAPRYFSLSSDRQPALARGCRYRVELAEGELTVLASEAHPLSPARPVLPRHKAPPLQVNSAWNPPPAGMLALDAPEASTQPLVAKPNKIWTVPQPPRAAHAIPALRLEPIDAKPLSDFIEAAPVIAAASATETPAPAPASSRRFHVPAWSDALGFWRNAPRDLKLLVFAIPALIALAFHPTLPKVHLSTSGSTAGFRQMLDVQLAGFRQTVLDRAGIALDEDFRSGLDDWASRGKEATEWSYDATGFVLPGQLALYRPSTGLSDYQMQFLGMIDKKALSWVVRAADFDNYYVVKLAVVKPGPLPTIGVTRYAVIHGVAQNRADVMVPVSARADTLYRIRMDLRGDDFTLTVQGQTVDTWSEPRLRHGGIGFFSARGEESRVRWVQVTHQYDMLGRLCAYLAPYNISSTNGSWQP